MALDEPNGAKMSGPACSVIVPAYKTTAYIAETLDSILAQTFQDFEIVVANDGCPDTENLERVLAPYRDRIVYVKQKNDGLGAARNLGIRTARAPLVAFLDSDDLWEKNYLETQVGVLSTNPEVDIACCDAILFGEGSDVGKLFSELCPSTGEINFQNVTLEKAYICISVTGRKATFENAGMFFQVRGSEDYATWLKMLLLGAVFKYTHLPLIRYRRRPDSLSADLIKIIETNMNAVNTIRAWRPELTPEQSRILDARYSWLVGKMGLYQGKNDLRRGDYDKAKSNLQLAAKYYDPSFKLKAISQLVQVAPGLVRSLDGFLQNLRKTP